MMMQGIDLAKFRGLTQTRDDYCLLACIQNILYYYGDKNSFNQFQLDTLFRQQINPRTDHPYFKYFAKYLNTIIPEFQGIYKTYNYDDLKAQLKSSLDAGIPVIISLNSLVADRAHIVVATQHDNTSLRYFDPNPQLSNNFISIRFSEFQRELKGIDKFDTLTVVEL